MIGAAFVGDAVVHLGQRLLLSAYLLDHELVTVTGVVEEVLGDVLLI